jgi:SAM-dependent methyltransferase
MNLARLRRGVYGLRTEGSGPVRETAAIACGVFIGCQPVYGFHLLICWLVGWAFGLNRLKLYLAANISNPLVAPFLLFSELQCGSLLRRGTFHAPTLEGIRAAGAAVLGVDLLLGSVVIGAVLAGLAAWGTYATIGKSSSDSPFVDLVRRASDRYVGMSVTAWEFARGKLRNDPVYRAAVYEELLGDVVPANAPASDHPTVLVDVGCGQGLMLALLSEVRHDVRNGRWSGPAPRVFDRMVGIETRARVAGYARVALGDEAEILTLDARSARLPAADVVLLFDVLHLMPAADQDSLLASLVSALRPGGVLIIRDADAAAGWRFAVVRAGNWLKAMAVGQWRQSFHFRTTEQWTACFAQLGLKAEARQMGRGTPFGNVLFRLVADERAAKRVRVAVGEAVSAG